MTKLFPNSPGNYHNHNPTSEYDQETITIIDPTRIDLQETITIIDPTRIIPKIVISQQPRKQLQSSQK